MEKGILPSKFLVTLSKKDFPISTKMSGRGQQSLKKLFVFISSNSFAIIEMLKIFVKTFTFMWLREGSRVLCDRI